MTDLSAQSALVTGANSGLGFEAAGQLVELGFGSVTLACRSQDKADAAAGALKVRTGADVFETLVVDVADIGSSRVVPMYQSRARCQPSHVQPTRIS